MARKETKCCNRLCASRKNCGRYIEPVGEYAWQYDMGIKRITCSRYMSKIDKGYYGKEKV